MARGKFRPDVASWGDLGSDRIIPEHYQSLVLAEGDSWFTLGGLPTSNILFSMRFHKTTLTASCAKPGDTLRNMAELAANTEFQEALSGAHGLGWELILLSAGGNDLIDEARTLLLDPEHRAAADTPEDYVDSDKVETLVGQIQNGYRTLVEVRDQAGGSAVGVPILVHTYDYATPRNAPARFLGAPVNGPWLIKALEDAEVPERMWNRVSDHLFDCIAEGILALDSSAGGLPEFHVVDTRNLLMRAVRRHRGSEVHATRSGDWMNEIHPDVSGYEKIAKALDQRVEALGLPL